LSGIKHSQKNDWKSTGYFNAFYFINQCTLSRLLFDLLPLPDAPEVPDLPVVVEPPIVPVVASIEVSILEPPEVSPVVGPGGVFVIVPSVFAFLAESVLLLTLSSGLVQATPKNKRLSSIIFFMIYNCGLRICYS
jgi:hypothetical protein